MANGKTDTSARSAAAILFAVIISVAPFMAEAQSAWIWVGHADGTQTNQVGQVLHSFTDDENLDRAVDICDHHYDYDERQYFQGYDSCNAVMSKWKIVYAAKKTRELKENKLLMEKEDATMKVDKEWLNDYVLRLGVK